MKRRPAKVRARKPAGTAAAPAALRRLQRALERAAPAAESCRLDPMPVCELTVRGRLGYQNAAARRLFPDLAARGARHPWLRGVIRDLLPRLSAGRRLLRREVAVGGHWYQQTIRYDRPRQSVRIYGHDITAAKLAELVIREQNATLVEASQRTRDIIRSMTDGYFACDKRWRIISVNPIAAATIFGRPAAELAGKTCWRLAPLAADRPLAAGIRGATARGLHASFEWHNQANDSWQVVHVNPGSGRVDINFQDITQRKRAETALRESEQRYRSLAEVAPFGIAVHRGGVVLYANPAALRIIGAERPEQLVGRRLMDFVHPDFRGVVAERVRQMTAQGVATPIIEERFMRLDGGTVDVEVTASGMTYEGQPAVHVVFRDIGERLRAEAALRESEEHYRLLYNSINDSVWIVEAGPRGPGRFLEVNDQVCQRLGYSRAELLRMTVADIDARSDQTIADIYRRVRTQGQAMFEAEHITKDGRRLTMELNVRAITYQGKDAHMAVMRDITERKRVLEWIRNEQERFRALAENSAFGLALVDEDGRWVYVNPRFTAITGYGPEAVPDNAAWLALAFPGRHHNRQSALWRRDLLEVAAGARGQREVEARCGDGGIRTLAVCSSRLPAGGLLLSFEDVSERVRTERELAHRNALLNAVFDSAEGPIFAVDREYRYTSFNAQHARAMRELYGAEIGLGRCALDFYPAGDERAGAQANLDRALAGESVSVGSYSGDEARVRRYYLNVHSPMRDRSGAVTGVTVYGQDLTVYKRIEAELLASREMLEQLVAQRTAELEAFFKHSMTALVFMDTRFNYIRVNDAFAAACQLDAASFYGRNHFDLFPSEQLQREMERTVRTREPYRAHAWPLQFPGPAGRAASYWDLAVDPIAGPGGDVGFLVFSLEDVTERTLAEQELHRAQQQLEAARRLADVGTLAATVAHELRNPLAAIRMATHNIRRKADNPVLDRHLATIDKKVSDSDQIISNLLFYSRIRTAQYQQVDIAGLLDEVMDALAVRHQGRSVSIARGYRALAGRSIEADPLLLKELFENVLGNAVDAVADAVGSIEVAADVSDPERCVVRVGDNGPGIDPAVLPKVFEPFFSTKSKGTGLGLAVCRTIAGLHQGEVTIDSGAGRGTTVTVTLPWRRSSQ